MRRREFLKFSACGLSVVAVGSVAQWSGFWPGGKAWASSSHNMLELEMVEADAEMVDGVTVPMWAFMLAGTDHDSPVGGARIPGPAIIAMEGDHIHLQIRNRIGNGGIHGFAIPGVVDPVEIPTGGSNRVDIEFMAPAPGTYMYLDPFNAPVNRVMGLHGVLVVLPNPVGNRTPYAHPTNQVRLLFNDLGNSDHFPGNPWDPTRNAIWVFSTVDPVKNTLAFNSAGPLNPATFLGGYLPQYFTINGKSGFFGAQHGHHVDSDDEHDDHSHDDRFTFDVQANISLKGRVGQPILIRNVNAGLMWHSPHIHGNHVYPIARAVVNSNDSSAGPRYVLSNLFMVDTWAMPPGEIWDVLHAFIAPPDIPQNFWDRAALGINEEKFPLFYPMHDHNEISNTAAGGNYPHGLATHWQIDGPFDPDDVTVGVILVEKATLRVKTGRLELAGTFSVPGAGNVLLDIHSGGHDGALITNQVRVDSQGRWEYRGRALKALGSQQVSIMFHDPVDPATVHASRTVRLSLR